MPRGNVPWRTISISLAAWLIVLELAVGMSARPCLAQRPSARRASQATPNDLPAQAESVTVDDMPAQSAIQTSYDQGWDHQEAASRSAVNQQGDDWLQPSVLSDGTSTAPLSTFELSNRLEAAEAEIRALKSGAQPDPRSGTDSYLSSYAVEAPPPGGPWASLDQKWADFLKKAEAKDKSYPNVQIHGVFQADFGWYDRGSILLPHSLAFPVARPLADGADFRRARLQANGAVTETVNYFFQMDFAFFGRPTFTDVWVEQTAIPYVGAFRIGQWKQPFGLEVVSSFRYTTFMERSSLFQPFTPFRHLGVGIYNHADNLEWTWAASVFRSGQDQFGDDLSASAAGDRGPGGTSCCGRLTNCPYFDEGADGRYYLHLGLGFYFNAPDNHQNRFRSIPEFFVGTVAPAALGTSEQPAPGGTVHGTPFFVDTGVLGVTNYEVLGAELLWVNGPLSLQSEGMLTIVSQAVGKSLINPAGGPVTLLGGAYAQVGYFLTGEHRPYDRKLGAIDRIKPFENFFWVRTCDGPCRGLGAWELAARVSFIDLENNNITGGQMIDFTAGLNWYWNPNCKLVFNYIESFVNYPSVPAVGQQNVGIYAARAQLDF